MIRSKPDGADVALALILDDPILFSEFMRNTKDGSMDKSVWPKKPFKYRWYQRDLISDQSEGIILTGGRAIGKCAAGFDRLLTSEGYKKHAVLKNRRFLAWSLDKDNNMVLKRAVCLPNGNQRVRTITTQSDYCMSVTAWHPVLTDKGFILANKLRVGDLVAVTTKLPHVPTTYVHKDSEMRLIGYMLFQDIKSAVTNPETHFKFKSTSVCKDIERIAHELEFNFDYVADTETNTMRFVSHHKREYHPVTKIGNFFGLTFARRYGWIGKRDNPIPKEIMTLGEENLKSFLEAVIAQYATVKLKEFRMTVPSLNIARDMQELFLRFGIETKIERTNKTIDKTIRNSKYHQRYWYVDLVSRDERASYRLLRTFTIPGYKVGDIPIPAQSFDATDHYRFEPIKSITRSNTQTFAVQVEDTNTYVVENIHTHNSLVLEDKILFDVINNERQLVETPELVLTTANQNQLTPILDRLVQRSYSSPILKSFISSGLNRQKGTFDFKVGNRDIRIHARLAGQRGEANVVGLHLPRAIIDESQVYPLNTFKQLQPAINTWEAKTQVFAAGVPNGVENTTLYYLDQKVKRFKKYRIPATNNPYFTYQDYKQAIKDYGGEDSDLFMQLVLGRHGRGSEVVIGRDDISIEPFDFYNYAYRSRDKLKGVSYLDKLDRPFFKEYSQFMAGIDTGFVDPTIIQVFGLKNGKWYLVARYLLQRIEAPEQEQIINWLHEHFHFTKIAIDIGAAGQGAAMLQSLRTREEYKPKRYESILHGVQFSEKLLVGYNEFNTEIMKDTKTIGADELVRHIHNGTIVMSELDSEGISQLERIAKQKTLVGDTKYFILSETGKGVSGSDHIFASFICFCIGIRNLSFVKTKKKLGKSVI